ncbi:hypothetical protein ACOBR2_06535 [Telmatobacter bradus]|uniref:hypothetical protein n=1 Tax=Telmatobacter bradus TaxID=474953 RepID=UPI003B42C719
MMEKNAASEELIPINIGNINEGAMVQGFEIELQKALDNIADLNTPATAARRVTLELVLKPHSDRVKIETEFKCSCKLAAIETHKSEIFLGCTDGGTLIAFDRDPRQMSLWQAPKVKEVKPLEFRSGN